MPPWIHLPLHCILFASFPYKQASSDMAENTLAAEGARAAEILQAQQNARNQLEELADRAKQLAKDKGLSLEESEPEESASVRSAASGGKHAASPVGDDAMAAFIGKVARQFKNNDETVRTAVAALKKNGIEVFMLFYFCFDPASAMCALFIQEPAALEFIEMSEMEWPEGTKLSIKALVRASISAWVEMQAPKIVAMETVKPPVESTMSFLF